MRLMIVVNWNSNGSTRFSVSMSIESHWLIFVFDDSETHFSLLRAQILSINSCWSFHYRFMYLLLSLKYSIFSFSLYALRLWGFLEHSSKILELYCPSSSIICLKKRMNFTSPRFGWLLILQRHYLHIWAIYKTWLLLLNRIIVVHRML